MDCKCFTRVLCGALLCFIACGCSDAPDSADAAQQGPTGVPVDVTKVIGDTIRETVRAIGTLRSAEVVEIRPEVSALVKRIHFEEGTAVEQGAPLYTLDDAKLQRELTRQRAALDAAQANLRLANQTYDRLNMLRERNSASAEELDQAEATLQSRRADVHRLEAEIQLVEERLEDTRIHAPFAGMIGESFVDTGDFVQIGERLTSLYKTDPLETTFTVAERFAGRIQLDMPIEVTVTAYPETTFEGRISFISPAVRESTRDFDVKAMIANDEGLLKPGMFATVKIITRVVDERPIVPEEVLVGTREGYRVFVVSNGTVALQEVEIGLREPGRVEILEGLTIGQTVVRTGHLNLVDGAAVRIENESDAAS